MKFVLTFKTPDATNSIRKVVSTCVECSALDKDEYEEAGKLISKFVKYGEYVIIEFDTEAQTATVKEVKR